MLPLCVTLLRGNIEAARTGEKADSSGGLPVRPRRRLYPGRTEKENRTERREMRRKNLLSPIWCLGSKHFRIDIVLAEEKFDGSFSIHLI